MCIDNRMDIGFNSLIGAKHSNSRKRKKEMNAKQTVERMAAELTNAGYKLHSTEATDDRLMFSFVTPDNQNIFLKSEMFFLSASFNEYTNRWNAFFSYSAWGLFRDSENKSKMTYRQMWEQIEFSIKMESSFFGKVGA